MIQTKCFEAQNVSMLQGIINRWIESKISHLERVMIYETNQSVVYVAHEKAIKIMVTIFYEIVKK